MKGKKERDERLFPTHWSQKYFPVKRICGQDHSLERTEPCWVLDMGHLGKGLRWEMLRGSRNAGSNSKFNNNMISHLAPPLIILSCLISFPTLSFHSHMSYPEPNSAVFSPHYWHSGLKISSNANTSVSWLDYWHRLHTRFSVLSSSHLFSTCSNLRVFAHVSPLACSSFPRGLSPLYPVIFSSFSL